MFFVKIRNLKKTPNQASLTKKVERKNEKNILNDFSTSTPMC